MDMKRSSTTTVTINNGNYEKLNITTAGEKKMPYILRNVLSSPLLFFCCYSRSSFSFIPLDVLLSFFHLGYALSLCEPEVCVQIKWMRRKNGKVLRWWWRWRHCHAAHEHEQNWLFIHQKNEQSDAVMWQAAMTMAEQRLTFHRNHGN